VKVDYTSHVVRASFGRKAAAAMGVSVEERWTDKPTFAVDHVDRLRGRSLAVIQPLMSET
jgi:hypothetical protein